MYTAAAEPSCAYNYQEGEVMRHKLNRLGMRPFVQTGSLCVLTLKQTKALVSCVVMILSHDDMAGEKR